MKKRYCVKFTYEALHNLINHYLNTPTDDELINIVVDPLREIVTLVFEGGRFHITEGCEIPHETISRNELNIMETDQ